MGIREGHDLVNDIPTGIYNNVVLNTSEASGISQDPYLVITYTIIAPAVIKIDGGTIKIDGGTIKID